MLRRNRELQLSFIFVLALVFCAGCFAAKKKLTPISGINCHFSFKNVDREEDQQRVATVINAVAQGNVRKGGTANNPDYFFIISGPEVLDYLHSQILYKNPGAKASELHQIFNANKPSFSINYSMIDIAASIEVVVSFRITPGASLFYKAADDDEKDITDLVDTSGQVKLKTKISKGQDYIYARTVSERVERYIKINIYTQEVEDITKGEYPR